jgi:hypothetical protein
MTKEAAQELPIHKPNDHTIDVKEGETLPWRPVYTLSEKDLEVL